MYTSLVLLGSAKRLDAFLLVLLVDEGLVDVGDDATSGNGCLQIAQDLGCCISALANVRRLLSDAMSGSLWHSGLF